LSISVEEADESEMWLDLVISTKLIDNVKIKSIYEESLELVKMLSSLRKRMSD
jgi:four helix bundle protein